MKDFVYQMKKYGFLDGSYNIFIFNGKEFSSLNISQCEIGDIDEAKTTFNAEELKSILQENKTLEIFNEIVKCFEKQGIKITLGKFKYKKCN